jgi:alkanesulfonate monooxygenase SsuD/methylene tetrahydromethanopterin reductase-like flavin-dependent oxidoreductase (luciferase family)
VLANAIASIDQLSGGRAELGLGAGWHQEESNAYGLPFDRAGVRLDILEESVACVRGLLTQPVTTFEGAHFQLTEARCEPGPVQDRLPIWIGGGGERRTLRIAAQWSDGWNIPFVDPETFKAKRAVLHRHCETIGRDPAEIRCAVNVGLAWREEDFEPQFGAMRMLVRPGVLTGSEEHVRARVGEYVAAGADQVNIAVRAPWDIEGLQRLADALSITARP